MAGLEDPGSKLDLLILAQLAGACANNNKAMCSILYGPFT